MLARLSSDKSLPEPIEENEFIYIIDDTLLLNFSFWHLYSKVYLSNVQQTN